MRNDRNYFDLGPQNLSMPVTVPPPMLHLVPKVSQEQTQKEKLENLIQARHQYVEKLLISGACIVIFSALSFKLFFF